jgi:hypothetical protein
MPITFRCPSGHKLSVADNLASRKARCPVCRTKMFVPPDNSDPRQIARPAPEVSDEALEQAVDMDELDRPGQLHRTAAASAKAKRPDPGKMQTVQLLALALAAVALFNAGPAVVKHANLFIAPDWARLALLLACLQLVYVAWMASIPDWSTVFVGMLVFASVCALYAVAMAVVMFTPLDTPLPLGLSNVRQSAAGWCFAVLAMNGMMTYACGRVAGKWRRAHEVARVRMALTQ